MQKPAIMKEADFERQLRAFFVTGQNKEAAEFIRTHLGRVTEDGKRISAVLLEGDTPADILARRSSHLTAVLATALKQELKLRTELADAPLVAATKAIILAVAHNRVIVSADNLLYFLSKSPAFSSPQDFVGDQEFMGGLAAVSRTSLISSPLYDMIMRAVYPFRTKQEDMSPLQAVSDSVHAALRNARHNNHQLTTGGLVQTLLDVVYRFPDPALRIAVLSDPVIVKRPLHGIDHIGLTVAIVTKSLEENREKMTPELLQAIKTALPNSRYLASYEQGDYLVKLANATGEKLTPDLLSLETLKSFDATALMQLVFNIDGTDAALAARAREAFIYRPKGDQLLGLFESFARTRKEMTGKDLGIFREFADIVAANPAKLERGSPYFTSKTEEALDTIAHIMAQPINRENPMVIEAAEIACARLFESDVDEASMHGRIQTAMSGSRTMRANFRANMRAVTAMNDHFGMGAQARRAGHRVAALASRLVGAEAA